jgi:serine/threonine protein kinase
MEYLAARRIVHRDLAARNCLVGQNSVIKVADFGLSRQLAATEDYYRVQTRGKLPVRWMAVESLAFRKFSSKSDVWSFGVLMWEVFTFGMVRPYRQVEVRDLLDLLESGKRLHQPRGCPREAYALMMQCWDKDARVRPDFTALRVTLSQWVQRESRNGRPPGQLGQKLDDVTASMV